MAVSTTGARLPQERELTELRLLLETLADPGNPLLVAATLEGLFFGLTPAELYAAQSDGMLLNPMRPPEGTGAVAEALTRLARWRAWGTRDPADLLLERLLDETGLLPYAASQPLGDGRRAPCSGWWKRCATRRNTGPAPSPTPSPPSTGCWNWMPPPRSGRAGAMRCGS